jgi:hypothetical protein
MWELQNVRERDKIVSLLKIVTYLKLHLDSADVFKHHTAL